MKSVELFIFNRGREVCDESKGDGIEERDSDLRISLFLFFLLPFGRGISLGISYSIKEGQIPLSRVGYLMTFCEI